MINLLAHISLLAFFLNNSSVCRAFLDGLFGTVTASNPIEYMPAALSALLFLADISQKLDKSEGEKS